jgi:hypothetical protein
LPLQYQPGCPGLFRKKMELPGGRPKRDKTLAPLQMRALSMIAAVSLSGCR